jgi:hypothetical protein
MLLLFFFFSEFKTIKIEPKDKTEVSSSIDSSVLDGAFGEDVHITDLMPDRGEI